MKKSLRGEEAPLITSEGPSYLKGGAPGLGGESYTLLSKGVAHLRGPLSGGGSLYLSSLQ